MAAVQIDAAAFTRRLKKLRDAWEASNGALWGSSNSLVVAVGATSEDLRYLKSISLHLWLFGYELPDTIMVLTKTDLLVLTSQKKASLLEPLVGPCEADAGVKLTLLVKPKQEDGAAQMAQLLDAIKGAGAEPAPGGLPKDKHEGKVVEQFNQALADAGLTVADVSGGVGDLLSSKDAAEVLNVKKAAMLGGKVMKDFVVQQIESIIDEGKKVKHSKLSEMAEERISDPSKLNIKLKSENVDIAYPPVFQSGGKYDLRVSAPSDDSPLHEGVIVVSIGTRYSSYCANISRTYVINPTPQQQQEYEALLAAQEATIAALVDGATVSSVVEAAHKALQARGQGQLVERLSKNLGFGMGLEFRESANVLAAKNEGQAVRAGMVFNVCLGVAGLENGAPKDAKGKVYALQVADTVIVTEGGKAPEVATSLCPKNWATISYTLNDGDNEDEKDEKHEGQLADLTNGPVMRKTLRSDEPGFKSAEQLRKEKQEALTKQKNEETLRRLMAAKGQDGGGEASTSGRKISDVVAYRGLSDMPLTKDLTIVVDSKNEAVLLPMYGVMVPFHITTIKSVASTNQDSDHAHVRVSFNFGPSYQPFLVSPTAVFVKDLCFRSADVRHAAKVVQEIKLLRSTIMQRDKERAERAGLVAQEKLVQGKRVFKLPDLWIRPTFGGKGRKMPGTLEAHANGFRYWNAKQESINVMYRNIRHAFFQPAENEMITVVHFHLINPIMIGNKKTKDIQFYAEVMETTQTLDGGRRNMYDPDEIEEEQRERERRNKVNAEFQMFVKRVQEVWEKDFADLQLEFDIPFRELGFSGVPFRSTVFIQPTVNCLIELTEMPFLVVSLEDIEIVNLERVGFNLKNFDMAIVFKDFTRDVMRIDAIPSKSVETIKEWLTSVRIKYYESKLNLQWKPILKHIMEDPQGFADEGGWEFLNMERSDGEDDEDEQQSSDYAPSEGEEDASSDEDSEDASVVDSEEASEDDSEDEEDEEEEEGLTWDELEAQAKMEDRKREMSDDEDNRRGGGKRPGGGKAPPAKRQK